MPEWVDDPKAPDINDPKWVVSQFELLAYRKIIPEQLRGETPEYRNRYREYLQSIAQKGNTLHQPAGTPIGGQFAPKGSTGGTSPSGQRSFQFAHEYGNPQSINRSREESDLLNKKVVATKNLGGGVTETRLLTLEGGMKAVFKPHDGEPDEQYRDNISLGYQTEREVGAWEVAKVVGMEDMVTPAVDRIITTEGDDEGERGVLLQYQEGAVAIDERDEERYDGSKNLARAAVFDYVIGNEDRHGGNWIVSGLHESKIMPVDPPGKPYTMWVDTPGPWDRAKLHLIDHGLSFPDSGDYKSGNDRFIKEAENRFDGLPALAKRKATGDYTGIMPEESDYIPPMNYAKPYVDGKAKILAVLTKIGLPESSIKGVGKRIDFVAKATMWGSLRPQEGEDKPIHMHNQWGQTIASSSSSNDIDLVAKADLHIKRCEILKTTSDGQELEGTLILNGISLSMEITPGHERAMWSIRETAPEGPEVEQWFNSLPSQYTGSYLRAKLV